MNEEQIKADKELLERFSIDLLNGAKKDFPSALPVFEKLAVAITELLEAQKRIERARAVEIIRENMWHCDFPGNAIEQILNQDNNE